MKRNSAVEGTITATGFIAGLGLVAVFSSVTFADTPVDNSALKPVKLMPGLVAASTGCDDEALAYAAALLNLQAAQEAADAALAAWQACELEEVEIEEEELKDNSTDPSVGHDARYAALMNKTSSIVE